MQYQLDSLKSICEDSLSNDISIENATSTLILADMHNANELKTKCIQFIASNLAQVRATEGWKQLIKANQSDLLDQLFQALNI